MMRILNSVGVKESMRIVYPKMIQLNNMPEGVAVYKENTGRFVLPPFIRCSVDRLQPDGVYLICTFYK
jgi:hypothetical protein